MGGDFLRFLSAWRPLGPHLPSLWGWGSDPLLSRRSLSVLKLSALRAAAFDTDAHVS